MLALAGAILEVAIFPRVYGYPKQLLYAAAFFLAQRYVTRPTTARQVALASWVVVAFLIRHDHGIYLAASGLLTVALVPASGGIRERARRAATFLGSVALLTSPYLLYVQAYAGLWDYLQPGFEFRSAELARQDYVWPNPFGPQPFKDALLYEYWACTAVALLLLIVYRRRDDVQTMIARVAPIIAAAAVVDSTLVRKPLEARLPDRDRAVRDPRRVAGRMRLAFAAPLGMAASGVPRWPSSSRSRSLASAIRWSSSIAPAFRQLPCDGHAWSTRSPST